MADCTPTALLEQGKCLRCLPPGLLSKIQIYLLCQWANKTPTPTGCTDPDVLAWVARIVADSGSPPSDTTINAVCDYVTTLKSLGIWNDFWLINVMAPDSLSAMLHPIKFPPSVALNPKWINHGFLAADLNLNGLKGDGIAKYMDTRCDPFLIPTSDITSPVEMYVAAVENGVAAGDQIDIGIVWISETGDDESSLSLATRKNASGGEFNAFAITKGDGITCNQPFVPQFAIGKRDGQTANTIYFLRAFSPAYVVTVCDSVALSFGAAGPIGFNLFAMANNLQDNSTSTFGPAQFTAKRISYFAIKPNLLTALQEQQHHDAVRTMRLAMGGGAW